MLLHALFYTLHKIAGDGMRNLYNLAEMHTFGKAVVLHFLQSKFLDSTMFNMWGLFQSHLLTCATFPMTTESTASGETLPASRAATAAILHISVADIPFSFPPKVPKGVLLAATTKTARLAIFPHRSQIIATLALGFTRCNKVHACPTPGSNDRHAPNIVPVITEVGNLRPGKHPSRGSDEVHRDAKRLNEPSCEVRTSSSAKVSVCVLCL